MQKYNIFVKKMGKKNYLDYFFVTILFLIPIVSRTIFKQSINDLSIFFIFFIGLWGLFKFININNLSFNFLKLDFFIILVSIYSFINFYLLTDVNIFYNRYWLYLSYFSVFYLFRVLFYQKDNEIVNYFIKIVFLFCTLQIFIGLLQYFEIIYSLNNYYKFIGSFTSPNHLAELISLNTIILFWFITSNQVNIIKKNISLLLIGVFIFILFKLESRSSIISLLFSFIFLILNSSKKDNILKLIKENKIKTLILFLILLPIGINSLYKLKPDSVNGRFLITKICLNEIFERPILGNGLFSFEGKYNLAKANYFKSEIRTWDEIKNGGYIFNPNNDFLLIGFELGLVFLMFFVFIIIYTLYKTEINIKTKLFVALFINLCVFSFFNTIHNSVILMLIGLCSLAIIVSNIKSNVINLRINCIKNLIKVLFLLIFLIVLFFSWFNLNYKSDFKKMKNISKDNYNEFLLKSNSVEDNMFSGMYIGKILYNNGFKKEGIEKVNEYYKKSYAPKIGKYLAKLHYQNNDLEKTEEILIQNVYLEPYRFEPKMSLLNFYNKTKNKNKLLKVVDDIFNLPIKIQSYKIDKYKKRAMKLKLKYTSK